jgi:hypothetical protein
MTDRSRLDRFLRTDPRDVCCAQAMEMFHIYVELAAAGDPVEERYPGIAAHLRACGPCGEDFEGLRPRCATRPPDRRPPSRPGALPTSPARLQVRRIPPFICVSDRGKNPAAFAANHM